MIIKMMFQSILKNIHVLNLTKPYVTKSNNAPLISIIFEAMFTLMPITEQVVGQYGLMIQNAEGGKMIQENVDQADGEIITVVIMRTQGFCVVSAPFL